jgi:transcriptional regulator with XRE-family HTH domain
MGELVRFDTARKPRELEPLWRDVVGRKLRDLRHEQGERLIETATRAGISPQYLSEVERGRKDPSSEMLAAIAGALGTSLVDLTTSVAEELGARRGAATSASAPRAQLMALAA